MPFAQVQGIQTRYEVLGEGPALLLLAPVGFDDPVSRRWADRVWRGFRPLDALVPHFRVIVYDRRETGGTGGSVEPLSWALCAHHARGLLDHLGVEQAYLLGACVGCSVALALAAEYPERCRSLLLHWPVGGYHWLSRGRANFDRHIAFAREHGLKGVAELARRSRIFWSDPDAGPWSSIMASDDAFAESFVRQDLDRYLQIVEQSRDNLFSDTLPAGASCNQLQAVAAKRRHDRSLDLRIHRRVAGGRTAGHGRLIPRRFPRHRSGAGGVAQRLHPAGHGPSHRAAPGFQVCVSSCPSLHHA
jgi:pimeloyl-ACP methyl ester carboxylesterase